MCNTSTISTVTQDEISVAFVHNSFSTEYSYVKYSFIVCTILGTFIFLPNIVYIHIYYILILCVDSVISISDLTVFTDL